MFYTFFFRTALEVEDIVRSQGAMPATIGILNGQVIVGKQLNSSLKVSTIL